MAKAYLPYPYPVPPHPTPLHKATPETKCSDPEISMATKNLGWSGVLGKEVIVEKGQDSQHRLSLGSLGIPQAEKRRPPSAEQGQALGQ